MAQSTKLHDDLVKEVEPIEGAEESVVALLLSIASRIDTHSQGNTAALGGYAKSLREGSDDVTNAILANIPDSK